MAKLKLLVTYSVLVLVLIPKFQCAMDKKIELQDSDYNWQERNYRELSSKYTMLYNQNLKLFQQETLLNHEYLKLKNENDNLLASKNLLEREKRQLAEENLYLKFQCVSQKNEIEKVLNAHKCLLQSNYTMQQKNSESCDVLEREKRQLAEENVQLKSQCACQKKEIKEALYANEYLWQCNYEMQQKNSELNKLVHALKFCVEYDAEQSVDSWEDLLLILQSKREQKK